MTRKPASRETLERLAEAAIRYRDGGYCGSRELDATLEAYERETTPPLRARAEVDAEIGKLVRAWSVNGYGYAIDDATIIKLAHLCAEPTAPEGET